MENTCRIHPVVGLFATFVLLLMTPVFFASVVVIHDYTFTRACEIIMDSAIMVGILFHDMAVGNPLMFLVSFAPAMTMAYCTIRDALKKNN